MRIISGTLKGRSIDFLKNSNTRPLKDSVRENIFNILYHSNLNKCKILKIQMYLIYILVLALLELNVSQEVLVRVMFVEQDINAVKILRKN